MSAFVTGLLFGAVGSAHCLAMCGPLVMTIGRTLRPPTRGAQLRHAVCYHGARVLTYAVLGLVAGTAGQALAFMGLGRALAVAAGTVLLFVALGSVFPVRLQRLTARPAAIAVRACAAATGFGRRHPIIGPAAAGAANGLLPCGLVYAAVLTASALGTASSAVAMMVGFGLGTIPTLLMLSLAAALPESGLRSRLRSFQSVLLVVTAVILLVRGLAPRSPHHRVQVPSPGHSVQHTSHP